MSPAANRSSVSRNLTWSLGLVAAFAVVLTVVVLVIEGRSRADGVGASDAAATVRADSHVLSEAPEGAPVLVEFLDFECEGCAAWYPAVESLRKEYDGRVEFVARYFPLPSHISSVDAALAVEAAAQQGQFEQMYSRMYQTQTEWSHASSPQAEVFRGFAQELGLDVDAYDAAVAAPATLERVEADVRDGRELGVQGTPTFFLDGRKVEPQSPQEMAGLLEAALGD